MLKRLFGCLLTALLLAAPLAAMQPPTGAARDGFVPLDSLPPQEQLPAAPLLITAYVFVWVLLMTYLWSIARRLNKVEREMHTLQRRAPGGAAR
jgi:CcmD family protein